MRMKRTAQVLKEDERIQKIRSITQFFGKNLWQGDIPEMRDDGTGGQRRRSAPPRNSQK